MNVVLSFVCFRGHFMDDLETQKSNGVLTDPEMSTTMALDQKKKVDKGRRSKWTSCTDPMRVNDTLEIYNWRRYVSNNTVTHFRQVCLNPGHLVKLLML